MLQIRQGNTEAFDKLFGSYYPRLFRFLSSLVSTSVAEDLLQDLFLNIWKLRHTLNPEKPIQSYLFRAAKNHALNYLRHQKVERRESELFSHSVEDRAKKVDATSPTPEELYEQKFLQDELQKALQSLPERCRVAFVLSRYENLSHVEIADAMEISPKTVNNLIIRALELLRKRLRHLFSENKK